MGSDNISIRLTTSRRLRPRCTHQSKDGDSEFLQTVVSAISDAHYEGRRTGHRLALSGFQLRDVLCVT